MPRPLHRICLFCEGQPVLLLLWRRGRTAGGIGALLSFLAFCTTAADAANPPPGATVEAPREHIRGVVISCQTWGREWGSDAMIDTMHELQALGVNWVQIHPYGGVSRDGHIDLGRLGNGDAEVPTWLSRPIAEAHRLGLKICITPHLAPWRAGWTWRGDVAFETREHWRTFFEDYQRWITTLARMCRDADGFSVGSELDQTIAGHETEWREIIAAVKQETRAPLTYAANWPTYQSVPFWDALDCIGISAYFPLTSRNQAPNNAELSSAWLRIRRDVLRYAQTQHRRVVFMELGYDSGMNAAREPWADGDHAAGGALLQARCLDAALAAVDPTEDDLLGAFLWKWFPGESRGETFLLTEPGMRAVIKRHWAAYAPPP